MSVTESKAKDMVRASGRLTDRVVIVVGAGSVGPGWGNGKAAAVAFAREGAKVIAVDINEAAALETVSLIHEEGLQAEAFSADVTKNAEVEAVIKRCIDHYGRIDVLHYNVGIVEVGGCVELSEETWLKLFNVNVTGCFLFCKHVLPVMRKQGSGVILTIGSIGALRWSGVNILAYYASKAALLQFTRAVAMENARMGIRAVSILPGMMNTPVLYQVGFENTYSAGDIEKMVEVRDAQCPTGKMGDAWDVAHAAVFLASDDAKYITATELIVDGGVTAKFA